MVSTMGADVLAMQGARASTTMILTLHVWGVTYWPMGDVSIILKSLIHVFESDWWFDIFSTSCEIAPSWIHAEPHKGYINSGSGNGLVLSGNKQLPAAYRYHQYLWDWYLSTDTHIDTLTSFPSIYIKMSYCSGFAQSMLQKNTAETLWLARIIIPILNITLSTLNPMVMFTCSPHFSSILGFMPFARWIFAENSTNLPPNQHFCLHIFNDILLIYIVYRWIVDTIYIVSINLFDMQL